MADNVTTEELESALSDVLLIAGQDTVEYVESLDLASHTDLNTVKDAIQAQIDAQTAILESITETDPDNGTTSIQELLNSLKALLSDEDGLVDVLTKIQENNSKIDTAKAELQTQLDDNAAAIASNVSSVTGLSNDLSTLNTTVTDNKTATDNAIALVKADSDTSKATLETLMGDSTVDGSIAKTIADEVAARNSAIATAKQEAIDAAAEAAADNADVTELTDKVGVIEGQLNDSTDEDGNLVKGGMTRLSDVEIAVTNEVTARISAIEAAKVELNENIAANVLKASSMNKLTLRNKFREGLGLPLISENNDGDGESI
jgi:hypothetical protein